MPRPDIAKALSQERFGLFLLIIKPEFSVELRNGRVIVFEAEQLERTAPTPIEDRVLLGMYRYRRQLSRDEFWLEILADWTHRIPYRAIKSYTRLGDLPFPASTGSKIHIR